MGLQQLQIRFHSGARRSLCCLDDRRVPGSGLGVGLALISQLPGSEPEANHQNGAQGDQRPHAWLPITASTADAYRPAQVCSWGLPGRQVRR